MSRNNTSYSTFGRFGEAMNKNVFNPMDQSNPLTYCIIPTFNAQFLHGSTSSNQLYTPNSQGCINYMAERCADVYDGYCRAYVTMNSDTSYPNTGAIDTLTPNIANTFLKNKPTTGECMIRNAAERRFLVYPGVISTVSQFDPNVANSPEVRRYPSTYRPGPVGFQNLNDPVLVDQDMLIEEMCVHWMACFDVLTKIYKGYKDKNPAIQIFPSKFQVFLDQRSQLWEGFLSYLQTVPNYQYSTSVPDYYPEKATCYAMLGKGY